MCNKERSGSGNCIAEVLSVIDILQKNACPGKSCNEGCDRPSLGGGPSCLVCNTRPIQLFTCCGNGVPFSMPTCKDLTIVCSNPEGASPALDCSSVFRVEKLEGNCATFRVLEPNTNNESGCFDEWLATNSFFTMDLSCLCAIRCLTDTYVDCV